METDKVHEIFQEKQFRKSEIDPVVLDRDIYTFWVIGWILAQGDLEGDTLFYKNPDKPKRKKPGEVVLKPDVPHVIHGAQSEFRFTTGKPSDYTVRV